MENRDKVESILIPIGTRIHIDGMPFTLKNDIQVLGVKANLKLTDQLKNHLSDDKKGEI